MRDLGKAGEAALIECLEALDAGDSVESCRVRYPQQAETLASHLRLRVRLLALDMPGAPADAFASGRQALLEHLARPALPSKGLFRWRVGQPRLDRQFRSSFARVVAGGAIVFAFAAGALSASAAAGVQQAHDVLSALHIAAPAAQGDQHKNTNGSEGAANQSDGIGNAPAAAQTGQQHADDHASNGSDNANGVVPCLPGEARDRVTALQERFSVCPAPADTTPGVTPAEGLPTQTPAAPSGEHGQPTNTGLDHRPVTPGRQGDEGTPTSPGQSGSAPPTFVGSHATANGDSAP